MSKKIIFSIVIALLSYGTAYGQSLSGQPDPVQYTVAPETPGPHQRTTINVQGVGTFLGDATIAWTLDGTAVQSGVGSSLFSFTTGALGKQNVVQVTITSPTQGVIKHTFVFTPSVINLVWEANTTVPPLYAGKALYSPGSTVRIAAFPVVMVSGTRIAPQSLSYQWSVNDIPENQLSGLGKNSISFAGDQLQPNENISVDVYFGSLKVGHSDLTIPVTAPQIILYNKDPLRGVVWDEALPQAIALNTNEITLKAQPYYFAADNGALGYTWTLNNNDTTGPNAAQGELTLRQTGGGQGSANVAVSIQNNNTSQFVQTASTLLQLVFGQQSSGLQNLFGL